MNNALFRMSIADAVKVCSVCGVLKGHLSSNQPRKVVLPHDTSLSSYKNYIEQIQIKGEYDILLNDDSIFQFEKDKKAIKDDNDKNIYYDCYRYTFIQSPFRRPSFEEYCGLEINDPDFDEEFYRGMYEIEDLHIENDFPLYLRYDADLKGYLPNSHSYAHLHIGFHDGYRLPSSLIMTPKAFVCMVLKLVFPVQWETEVVLNSKNKTTTYSSLKSQCESLSSIYWQPDEEKDLFID